MQIVETAEEVFSRVYMNDRISHDYPVPKGTVLADELRMMADRMEARNSAKATSVTRYPKGQAELADMLYLRGWRLEGGLAEQHRARRHSAHDANQMVLSAKRRGGREWVGRWVFWVGGGRREIAGTVGRQMGNRLKLI